MRLAFSKKNIWERIPHRLKAIAGPVIRKIPPAVLLGKAFRDNLKFLERAQWWSVDEYQNYQLKGLQDICQIAFNHTIFYRELYKDLGFDPKDFNDFSQFRRLPFIDKDTLNVNLERMYARDLSRFGVDYTSTGGTSGVPLRFYIQPGRSQIEYAYLVSSWRRIGYEIGSPLAVFRGKVVRGKKDNMHYESDPILNHHYYSNFHMNDEQMRAYVNDLSRLGQCFLHVYPSSAFNLAKYVRRDLVNRTMDIKGIIAESENVYPEQRKFVEDTFGCRFFSCYGHTEKLVAASECENSDYYHVWPTYGFFELIDDNGIIIKEPGVRGEIVGTGFINRLVPFIRYRTGDYATYVSDHCMECGRNHPIIKDIRGHRIQEYLITQSRSRISWTALNMHDDTFDNVRRFQFQQNTPGHAILKIIPGKKFSDVDCSRIRKNLESKIGVQLRVDLFVVDNIPLTRAGKFIYVDQRIAEDR